MNIRFQDHLADHDNNSLHPYLQNEYKHFPEMLSELSNIILYGPPNVGKYTQMLVMIKKYSVSNLKYEKKLCVHYNKKDYQIKISDTHFEIDMALLGCNAKLLWNEIYKHIIDVLLAKSQKQGIIVCKNFHEIHTDLLDAFYTYLQSDSSAPCDIKYILLSEHLSFIPNDIINCCKTIRVQIPTKTNISNCKKTFNRSRNETICNKIISIMIDIENLSYELLRDTLYKMLIYNLDIHECVWKIISYFVNNKHINEKDMDDLFQRMYKFLEYYNNNYRPIYHLESFFINLIIKIHGIEQSPIYNEFKKSNDKISTSQEIS